MTHDKSKRRYVVLDTSGVPRKTIEDVQKLERLRTRAFFQAASAKLGDLQESNILDVYEGDLDAAAEALDITCEFEGAVYKLLEDARVNAAMDKADRDDDGQYYDLEETIHKAVEARMLG